MPSHLLQDAKTDPSPVFAYGPLLIKMSHSAPPSLLPTNMEPDKGSILKENAPNQDASVRFRVNVLMDGRVLPRLIWH